MFQCSETRNHVKLAVGKRQLFGRTAMELGLRKCLTAYIEGFLGNIDAGGYRSKRGSRAKPLTCAAGNIEQPLGFPGLKLLCQAAVMRGNSRRRAGVGVIDPIVEIAQRRYIRFILSFRLRNHATGNYPSSCRRPLSWRSMRRRAICSEIKPNMKIITAVLKANTDMLVKRFWVT